MNILLSADLSYYPMLRAVYVITLLPGEYSR